MALTARQRWWMLAASVGLLALAASFNGVWNGFVYDDVFVVGTNDLIHNLRRAWTLFFLPYWPIELGGDGYRPLTMVAFAVQWAIGSGSPMLFHAVTIGVYVAAAIAAFWLASQLLPLRHAWLVAAVFAVHPVHVEAVANVVGQSEVWAGLLLLCTTAAYVQWRRAGLLSRRRKFLVAVAYFVACLFKEHAIVLPALLIAAELLLIAPSQSLSAALRAHARFFLGLAVVGAIYFGLHELIIGKRLGGFDPYSPFVTLNVGYANRVLTMLGVVPHWVRLLLWPANLSSEYGPPQYPIATGVAIWQLPGLLILCGIVGIGIASIRRAPLVAFGIAWMVITLLPTSNLVLPSGVLLAERTLFTPSFGAMLLVVAAISPLESYLESSVSRVAVLTGAGAIVWAGITKSVVRTAAWRDNDTLFMTTVRENPLTYRGHYILGAWLMARNQPQYGESEFFTALGLFPQDPYVWYNLGQEYFAQRRYEQAYRVYEEAERVLPNFRDTQVRMALTKIMLGQYDEAQAIATRALRNKVGDESTLHAILGARALSELEKRRLGDSLARHVAPRGGR